MSWGYCVKCKATREMKNAQRITMKNGRPAAQGTCPVCGMRMFRIGLDAAPTSHETCPGCDRPIDWPHADGCPNKP
jgi:hypothetical protein